MVVSHRLSRRAVVGSTCFVVLIALTLQGCGNSKTSSLFPLNNIVSLFVPDSANNRVLIYNPPFLTGQGANVVLGQSSFTTATTGSSATTMSKPSSVGFDNSRNLYVAENGNCRVLQFKPPFVTGMAATLALGQPDLNTGNCNSGPPPLPTASNLNGPGRVAGDSHGNVWVADSGYSRVLQYATPLSTGKAAGVVIGQPDFTTGSGCPGLNPTTAADLCTPNAVTFDSSGNLWVADSNSHRVLRYTPPFTNHMDATLELGQPSGTAFTSGIANNGGLAASTLAAPAALAFDSSGNLWVADKGNNRVLKYSAPFSNGMPAVAVLGQGDFTSNSPNQGNASPSANSLSAPQGLQFDSDGGLFVGDSSNNRTLRFSPPFSNGMAASIVIGQTDFTQAQANQGGANPSATTQNSPFSAGPSFIALAVLATLVLGWYFVRRKQRSKGVAAA
jgi:sugar lactone lactonase YvrE